jgi:hypothetical protein
MNGWNSFENISEKRDPGAACREMFPSHKSQLSEKTAYQLVASVA